MYRSVAIALTSLLLLLLAMDSTHLQAENQILATASATSTPVNISLSLSQAQNVTTLIELMRAYNAGHLEDVLALLDEKVGWSDCDFQNSSVVNLVGKTKVSDWLQKRFADHDFLEIATLELASIENQDATTKDVVGVVYLVRTSDTLKNLGFPKGIKPSLASKVVFTPTHEHVLGFANGPYGGSAQFCRPSRS